MRRNGQGGTNNVDFVVGEETDTGCAARNLLLIFGVCSERTKSICQPRAPLMESEKSAVPLSIARSVARKPSLSACS